MFQVESDGLIGVSVKPIMSFQVVSFYPIDRGLYLTRRKWFSFHKSKSILSFSRLKTRTFWTVNTRANVRGNRVSLIGGDADSLCLCHLLWLSLLLSQLFLRKNCIHFVNTILCKFSLTNITCLEVNKTILNVYINCYLSINSQLKQLSHFSFICLLLIVSSSV